MTATLETAPRTDLARKFGIELEFASRVGCRSAGDAISAAGVPIKNHNGFACHQHNNNDWQLKTDATAGLELVSRVLSGAEGFAEMTDYVAKLQNLKQNETLGFKITKDCGFHAHIDVSDFAWKQLRNLVRIILKYEELLLAFQPRTRTGNQWTGEIRKNDIYGRLAAAKNSTIFKGLLPYTRKYYGLNLKNFLTRGTVEFRYAAGTLNPKTVAAWVTLLMGLVEIAKTKTVSTKISGRLFRHLRGDALYQINILRQYNGWAEGLTEAKKTLVKRFKKFTEGRQNEIIRYASAV